MSTWFINSYHGHSVQLDAKDTVSADRAMAMLAQLLGDGQPHPSGTEENFAVRDRLIQQIEAIGLTAEQSTFEAGGISLHNVLTSVPGDSTRRPIMLATHYDSVPWGPGAGDAGSCVVALLEAARVLNEQRAATTKGQLPREVFFLFTDGEEWVREIGHGLNGAIYFAEDEQGSLFKRNPIVLNLDARGASGPSLMFETSPNNYKLLKHSLKALPRPAYTASSYVTVYNLLPNATDFTVFKSCGLEGLNFGFLDEPHRYHTPDDTIANLDSRSVQHHANNAIALANCFLEIEVDDFASDQNGVFFTLLGQWIVFYPERLAIPFAVTLFLIQLTGTMLALRRGATGKGILGGVFAFAITLAGSILAGFALTKIHSNLPKSAHGFGVYDPLLVGILWIAVLLIAIIAFGWQRAPSAESTWTAIWMGWAVFGLVISIALPGFSYLMLAIGVAPAILSLFPQDKSRLTVAVVAIAAVVIVPLAYQFGIALGARMAMILGGLYAILLSPLYPLLVRVRSYDTMQ